MTIKLCNLELIQTLMFANVTNKGSIWVFTSYFQKKKLRIFEIKVFLPANSFISDNKSKCCGLTEGSQNSLKVYFSVSVLAIAEGFIIPHNVCSSPAEKAHHLLTHIFTNFFNLFRAISLHESISCVNWRILSLLQNCKDLTFFLELMRHQTCTVLNHSAQPNIHMKLD